LSVPDHDYKDDYTGDFKSRFEVLKSVMDNIKTPVFSLDTGYRYTSFNKAHHLIMKELYGVDIKLGKNILQYQSVKED